MPLLISVQTPHGRHLKLWGGKCMAESKTAQMMRLAREFHATEEAETGAVQTAPRVGRPPGKRSNPNFERLTELVQKLLAEFIHAHRRDNEVAESHYHV